MNTDTSQTVTRDLSSRLVTETKREYTKDGGKHTSKIIRTYSRSEQNSTEMTINIFKSKIPLVSSSHQPTVVISEMLVMLQEAWSMPVSGRDLAVTLTDALRTEGLLDILVEYCKTDNAPLRLESARLLEQSLTFENRCYVAHLGLATLVGLAACREDEDLHRTSLGILESLFKLDESNCRRIVDLGGLNAVVFSCRLRDDVTLRHCAAALANCAIYGGDKCQRLMVQQRTAEWLFPLVFSSDDFTRYYGSLAIAALSANPSLESQVVRSGTLDLVEPFIIAHDPVAFAKSEKSHMQGRTGDWLAKLLPLLRCRRKEVQQLAAFHFAMEAAIKREQGKTEIFTSIGAIEPLKEVAAGPYEIASRLAAQALITIGQSVPRQLNVQVPLWTTTDVLNWLDQIGFTDFRVHFLRESINGHFLLTITDEELMSDIRMSSSGLTRKRFLHELSKLRMVADYSCVDDENLCSLLRQLNRCLVQYTYSLISVGVTRNTLHLLSDDILRYDCGVTNGFHRLLLLNYTKDKKLLTEIMSNQLISTSPSIAKLKHDVFLCYRRSSGSQLASLLKVHLQLRGFSVFIDIEKCASGKFDKMLLDSISNTTHFIAVLTADSLDRCVGDTECKDWVHREIVTAVNCDVNVIPVTHGFRWPAAESLPEDMKQICFFNGVNWVHDYQDACIDKLVSFMKVKETTECAIQPLGGAHQNGGVPTDPQAGCHSDENAV